EVATAALHGEGSKPFGGADMSTKLKLMGVDVASLGDAHAATPDAQCCTLVDERAGVYKKLVISADGKRLLGGILVGDAADHGTWVQYMVIGMPLPARPEATLGPAGEEGAGTGPGIAALPAGAHICSCNNVSKSDICTAVGQGVVTLGGIKKATRAASTCGGGPPLAPQGINAELGAPGVAAPNRPRARSPPSRPGAAHLAR